MTHAGFANLSMYESQLLQSANRNHTTKQLEIILHGGKKWSEEIIPYTVQLCGGTKNKNFSTTKHVKTDPQQRQLIIPTS